MNHLGLISLLCDTHLILSVAKSQGIWTVILIIRTIFNVVIQMINSLKVDYNFKQWPGGESGITIHYLHKSHNTPL